MIVVTLTDCPAALRGDLTKWLQEINTGVYVGQVSARVRDEIWKRVKNSAKSGRATMVFSTNNEQRMDFRIHNTSWEPIDFDGLKLILRPSPARIKKLSELRIGYSNAAKARKAKQMSRRKHDSNQYPERYIVLNLETTGTSSLEHEIIEIEAIVINNCQIESKFHSHVKAKSMVHQPTTANGNLQKKRRDLEEVLKEFLEFAGNLPVISHSADFDYSFLRTACESCGLPLFSNPCIDTLALARRLVEDVRNHNLETLINHFGMDIGENKSPDICTYTKQLYEKLIEIRQLAN